MEQRIISNPVLQEAIKLFGATITEIELFPPSSSPASLVQIVSAPPLSLASVPAPPTAYRETSPAQPINGRPTLWDLPTPESPSLEDRVKELEKHVDDLELQVRRRQREKEALRRQVTKLGGEPCA